MSSTGKIIIQRLEDVLSVPLEAVFEVEGKPVVYLANRKPHNVEVGRRTDTEIEVVSGLSPGERICLLDPRTSREGMPGDKATEPELNKGRGNPRPGAAGRPGARKS
jgi:multidrug efflux pump subunit AcrA (membrane-fusion protein)